MKPHMTEAELALLKKSIPFGGNVLEFGSGGSTGLFFENGVRSLVSVESDPVFLHSLAKEPVLAHFQAKGRWTPLHADIGPVGEWGSPVSSAPQPDWLNYHQHVWEHLAGRDFDFVFIDGRFRVACLCQTILNLGVGPAIAMHDYSEREYYHIIEEFCECQEQAESMALFRVRADLNWRRLAVVLLAHLFDCR